MSNILIIILLFLFLLLSCYYFEFIFIFILIIFTNKILFSPGQLIFMSIEEQSPSKKGGGNNNTNIINGGLAITEIPVFEDGMTFITLAIQAISQDEFSKCFEPKPLPRPSSYLHYYLYLVGSLIRYGILFPLRLSTLIISSIIFIILLPFVLLFGSLEFKSNFFLAYLKTWNFSFGAWVRHWGIKPDCKRGEPLVFVSNHTSFVDFIVLSSNRYVHATVAQTHGGLFGLIQNYLMSLNGSLCFHRNEAKDRILVTRRIKRHLKMENIPGTFHQPLLIFPEGTCVNNECTVLFHKGAFELDCLVCPVAIKYNKRLLDPYWNTREQTFSEHCLYIMTRWLMIVDVWWLPPVQRLPGESSIEMAERVKEMISKTAGLRNLSWDGYMKNFIKSHDQEKLRKCRQAEYASKVKLKLPPCKKQLNSISLESMSALPLNSSSSSLSYHNSPSSNLIKTTTIAETRKMEMKGKERELKNGNEREKSFSNGNGNGNDFIPIPSSKIVRRRRTIDLSESREAVRGISTSLPESSSNSFLFLEENSMNPFPSWLPDSTVIDLKNELLLHPHSSKMETLEFFKNDDKDQENIIGIDNDRFDENYEKEQEERGMGRGERGNRDKRERNDRDHQGNGEHDDLLTHLLDHRADLVTTWRHFTTTGHHSLDQRDRRIENGSWRLLSSTINNTTTTHSDNENENRNQENEEIKKRNKIEN